MRKRKWWWAFGVFVVGVGLFLGFAVTPLPDSAPPKPLLRGAEVPASVVAIMDRACVDCHSRNTRWPWYARVHPAAARIRSHAARGRKILDLSAWQDYSKAKRVGALTIMSISIEKRSMPPLSYRLMHPEARLTDDERRQVVAWAKQERMRLMRLGRQGS